MRNLDNVTGEMIKSPSRLKYHCLCFSFKPKCPAGGTQINIRVLPFFLSQKKLKTWESI